MEKLRRMSPRQKRRLIRRIRAEIATAVLKAVVIVLSGMLIALVARNLTLPKNDTIDNVKDNIANNITDSNNNDDDVTSANETNQVPPCANKNHGNWAEVQWVMINFQESSSTDTVQMTPNFGVNTRTVSQVIKADQAEILDSESNEETSIVEPTPQISANGAGEAYYYNISSEDKLYIAKMVYAESRGEPLEGKVAVAAVALNRYVSNDPFFENDSIYSVITQSGQFASISWITEEDLASYPDCMEAVELACKGWDPTREAFPETGALFFYAPNGDISEYELARREGVPNKPIGNHIFHCGFND